MAYIDVLRVLAVAWLVPFHAARVFDIWEPFYAKSADTSIALTALIGLTGAWHMPLLFVLAGMSTAFALRRRSNREYVRERVLRLLVPFAFGLLVIVPPQAYIAAQQFAGASTSYPAFLVGYAEVDFADLSGYRGGFTPGHLWFILYLFVLSVAALPIIRWARSPRGSAALERLAARTSTLALVTAPPLLLAATELLPDPGGKNPFTYFVLFVAGYLLLAHGRFLELAGTHVRAVAVTGVALLVGLNLFWLGFLPLPDPAFGVPIFAVARSAATWLLVLTLLAVAGRLFTAAPRWAAYAGEVAYPFYIWHQTVLVVIAFAVLAVPMPVPLAFLAITAATFLATGVLTEATRRWSVTRFLFGMKPRPAARQPARLEPPEVTSAPASA